MSRQATPSETVLGILRAARVVPVLRGETPEEVLDTAGILQTEGFTTLEITFTVPDAPQLIRTLAATTGVTVGAGTITSATMLDVALEAGATFFVSPGLDEVLLAAATALGIPYLPGTLTPSDIMRASARGASVLKLFPGSLGGPNYLKAMRDPFSRPALRADRWGEPHQPRRLGRRRGRRGGDGFEPHPRRRRFRPRTRPRGPNVGRRARVAGLSASGSARKQNDVDGQACGPRSRTIFRASSGSICTIISGSILTWPGRSKPATALRACQPDSELSRPSSAH